MESCGEAPGTRSARSSAGAGKGKSRLWWLMVAIAAAFVVAGQTTALLLGRFYFDNGGNSKWMATLVVIVGFPVLVPALFLLPDTPPDAAAAATFARGDPPAAKLALVYAGLGLLVAGDNLMYAYGLLYLPVSTFSLICASQLAFSAVFSYFLNAQRLTHLIFNSVVLLTFSAALLGVHGDSQGATSVPSGKYALGFALTLAGTATNSLVLSLMQVALERVLRKETPSVVLHLQIFVAAFASCVVTVGLFASGEWRTIGGEMRGFHKGRASYALTLAGMAISWQLAYLGSVALVFLMSSLFAIVVNTISLPMVPVFAVVFFRDRMDGVKIMALLLAIWGFVSYIYQSFLDESETKLVETVNVPGEEA